MGHPEWDLAPQAAFRITRRVRGLQNSPHRIHFRSRLDGKFDLEPHLGQQSEGHPRDEVHEGGGRTAIPAEVGTFVAH